MLNISPPNVMTSGETFPIPSDFMNIRKRRADDKANTFSHMQGVKTDLDKKLREVGGVLDRA